MGVRTTHKNRRKLDMLANIKNANGVSVRAGVWEGSGKAPPTDGGWPMWKIATHLHEGPVGKKRKRWPYQSIAFDDNKGEYKKATRKMLKHFLQRRVKIGAIFVKLGTMMSNDQKKALTAIKEPKEEPATIAAKKGKSNPLVRFGNLRNAHAWQVED